MYALSANRTGSCRLDEKRKLAVYVLHPAETLANDKTPLIFSRSFLLFIGFGVG